MEGNVLSYKRCSSCGNFFSPIKSDQKYCRVCKDNVKYYRPKPMLKKQCKTCKTLFETRRKKQIFCSIKCKNEYHYKYNNGTTRVCPNCGEEFDSNHNKKIYCCYECYLIVKRKRNHRIRKEIKSGSNSS